MKNLSLLEFPTVVEDSLDVECLALIEDRKRGLEMGLLAVKHSTLI
jgi:hypothetical protein